MRKSLKYGVYILTAKDHRSQNKYKMLHTIRFKVMVMVFDHLYSAVLPCYVNLRPARRVDNGLLCELYKITGELREKGVGRLLPGAGVINRE